MSIAPQLAAVHERIRDAATRAGRAAEEVTLVAVSKRKPVEAIAAARDAGCLDFGENYVQELVSKAEALPELRWHFIGHLQRNKAKVVVGVPGLVLLHGVDDPRLVGALDRRAAAAERTLDVLVQVNVSGEQSKSGCAPSEVAALLDTIDAATHVRARGLMTMPPPSDPEQARPFFVALRELRDDLGGPARLPELSMGMSGDFEVAIEEGATIVRVGTAIFGARTT